MDERRRRFQHLILQAMARPEHFLAAALGEWPDEDVAAEIGAPVDQVYRLRLMDWPRTQHWREDVDRMARSIGADPGLLDVVLRGIQR